MARSAIGEKTSTSSASLEGESTEDRKVRRAERKARKVVRAAKRAAKDKRSAPSSSGTSATAPTAPAAGESTAAGSSGGIKADGVASSSKTDSKKKKGKRSVDPEYEAALTLATLGGGPGEEGAEGEPSEMKDKEEGVEASVTRSGSKKEQDKRARLGKASQDAKDTSTAAPSVDHKEQETEGDPPPQTVQAIDPSLEDISFPGLTGLEPATLAEVITQPFEALTDTRSFNMPEQWLDQSLARDDSGSSKTNGNDSNTTGARKRAKVSHTGARKKAKAQKQSVQNNQGSDLTPLERLAGRWLERKDLNNLIAESGIEVKQGKFSSVENEKLRDAVEAYRIEKGMTSGEIETLIQASAKERKAADQDHGNFWFRLTQSLDRRPVFGVYHHVRRLFHPDAYKGAFKADERRNIEHYHQLHGNEWEKIGALVGRTPGDVRDFCRHELGKSKDHANGRWTTEETKKYEKIIDEQVKRLGADELSHKANWKEISKLMGGKRTDQQCRAKWHQSYETKYKMNLTQDKWTTADFYMLVKLCAEANKSDESEVDFRALSAPNWDYWTRPIKRNKLAHLRKSHALDGREALTWQEEVNAYVKYFEEKYQPHELELPADRTNPQTTA